MCWQFMGSDRAREWTGSCLGERVQEIQLISASSWFGEPLISHLSDGVHGLWLAYQEKRLKSQHDQQLLPTLQAQTEA